MDTRAVWVEPADALDAVVRQMTRHHVRSVSWSNDPEALAGSLGW